MGKYKNRGNLTLDEAGGGAGAFSGESACVCGMGGSTWGVAVLDDA